MINAQRTLLAVVAVLSFFVLKHLWDNADAISSPRHQQGFRFKAQSLQDARIDPGDMLNNVVSLPSKPLKPTINLPSNKPPETVLHDCRSFPGSSDILVVLKTGATEIFSKLPIHFLTTFACMDDYLIFSDLAQQIGPHTIHDALADVSQATKSTHPNFDLYHRLQQRYKEGGSLKDLRGEGSWNLDKWKFLPMVKKSLDMNPNKQWFMFIEADTYLSWHNLLLWTERLNASEPVFAGAQVMIGDTEFAHGGSGTLLSRAAAQSVALLYTNEQSMWDQKAGYECCGDKILAEALKIAGVRLLRAFPLIQEETVWSLDWSKTHWCRPAVTWHHAMPDEVDSLRRFEQLWHAGRDISEPLLFKDVWNGLAATLTAQKKSNWDNMSKDWTFERGKIYAYMERIEKESIESWENCRALCASIESCLQWVWKAENCSGSFVMRLGKAGAGSSAHDESVNSGPVSGWMFDRIADFKNSVGPCDEAKRWITRNED